MTMDERVEAAVEAFGLDGWATLGLGDIRLSPKAKELASQYVREILAAAFPELHGDKTHWLAPMFATPQMIEAPSHLFKSDYPLRSGSTCWVAMRDAYLGKGDGG